MRSSSVSSRVVRAAWPPGCALTATPWSRAQRTAVDDVVDVGDLEDGGGLLVDVDDPAEPGAGVLRLVGRDEPAGDSGPQRGESRCRRRERAGWRGGHGVLRIGEPVRSTGEAPPWAEHLAAA